MKIGILIFLIIILNSCSEVDKQTNEIVIESNSSNKDVFIQLNLNDFKCKDVLQIYFDVELFKNKKFLLAKEFNILNVNFVNNESILSYSFSGKDFKKMAETNGYAKRIKIEKILIENFNSETFNTYDKALEFVHYLLKTHGEAYDVLKFEYSFLSITLKYIEGCEHKYGKWLTGIKGYFNNMPNNRPENNNIIEEIIQQCEDIQ